MTMNADQVRQAALEIARAAIDCAVVDPDLWQSVPLGLGAAVPRATDAELDAVRAELRGIAEGVASSLRRLLPPPVQPAWAPQWNGASA
jgi:hypothetical protein